MCVRTRLGENVVEPRSRSLDLSSRPIRSRLLMETHATAKQRQKGERTAAATGLRTTFTSLAQFSDASYAVSVDRVVFVVRALSVCVSKVAPISVGKKFSCNCRRFPTGSFTKEVKEEAGEAILREE